MDDPTGRNRLAEAPSPYLRAHADNPVHWQPWDDAARQAARDRDVPIFLSIGYSACHWCHVMAEESFEDEGIAAQLNESFVPIKVDREERPDIDTIYMTACQVVRGGGCGWPLSVWLTPEGNPFYVGTYFPKESSRGQPGFADLLDRISNDWSENRAELEERGRQVMDAVTSNLESTPTRGDPPGSDVLGSAARDLVDQADRECGGFGTGQKFPQPSRLELLALAWERTEVDGTQAVFTETLDAMIDGGLRDHLGGGFHRYCVDRDWTVPHFEKMLYDNATIPRALIAAFQSTGVERYATVAAETFEFIESELTHPGGGFYSTLDARSPPLDGATETPRGVEGAYYVWTPDQVSDAMAAGNVDPGDPGDTVGQLETVEVTAKGTAEEADNVTSNARDPEFLADLARARYGVTEAGNFEGSTVLTLAQSVEELASSFEEQPTAINRALAEADTRLRNARAKRPRPPRDEKILAGWNGLMIDALAQGAVALDEPTYAERARQALEFVRDRLWDGTTLARRYTDLEEKEADEDADTSRPETVGVPGVLEDYAFLARGALSVFEATGDIEALAFGLDLTRSLKRTFWDADRKTLFYTPSGGEDLPVRPQEVADGSTPSSMGVGVEVLLAMDEFAPTEGFGDIASAVLGTHGDTIGNRAMEHPSLVRAAEIHSSGHLEVVIAGVEPPAAWVARLGRRYLPDRLIAHRPPDEATMAEWADRLGLEEIPPLWANREAAEGPTAYVCRRACSPPVTSVEALDEWVDEFGW